MRVIICGLRNQRRLSPELRWSAMIALQFRTVTVFCYLLQKECWNPS
jgi:hypothetical protein